MDHQNDSYLLEKLKEGDPDAFDTFFLKYYKLLVANALFFIKDEQEAKDIVQELLFEFWHKKLYERLTGDMKGYLYKSVQNKCFNLNKKKTLEEHNTDFSILEENIPEDPGNDNEEELARLEGALSSLPQQRKEVLQKIYFEDKKYQEAADEMGISLNTFKTHLKISLRNLRKKLADR